MKRSTLYFIPVLAFLCSCEGGGNPLSKLVPPATPSASSSPSDSNKSGPEVAIVERVFSATDNGFSCISYQITWHGQQVIVQDPIHSSNFKVGDKIGVLVMRHDMSSPKEPNGEKLLNFQILPFIPGEAH